jgi:hypothetical protein
MAALVFDWRASYTFVVNGGQPGRRWLIEGRKAQLARTAESFEPLEKREALCEKGLSGLYYLLQFSPFRSCRQPRWLSLLSRLALSSRRHPAARY